jgi:hypothetical protein
VSGGASRTADVLEGYDLFRMVSGARSWEDYDMSRTGVVQEPSRARLLRRRSYANGPGLILFPLEGLFAACKEKLVGVIEPADVVCSSV